VKAPPWQEPRSLKGTILVRSNEVDRVDRTMHELDDLIRQGIVLTAYDADFELTKLNDFKARMLRETTAERGRCRAKIQQSNDRQAGARRRDSDLRSGSLIKNE
jgi:hypothetical protein